MLRVRVVAGTRRRDLVVPSTVPVADLIPDLAGELGLDAGPRAPGGYTLTTSIGRELDVDVGLVAGGITDGAVLCLTPTGLPRRVPHYDDPAEEVAACVRDAPSQRFRVRAVTVPALIAAASAVLLSLALQAGPGVDPDATLAAVAVLAVVASGANTPVSWAFGARIGPMPARVDRAHTVLAVAATTVSSLLVVAAPSAVSLGHDGTAVITAATLVALLGTRRVHPGHPARLTTPVLVTALATTAAAAARGSPAAGTTVIVCSLVVTFAFGWATQGSLRVTTMLDVLEVVCALSLLPLLVLATGVFDAVRG